MRTISKALSVSALALVAAGCKLTPNPTPLDKPGDMPATFTAPVVDKAAPIWPAAPPTSPPRPAGSRSG